MTTESNKSRHIGAAFGLPDLCYVHIPGKPVGQHIGIVKRGEEGYYPAPGMTLAAADRKNEVMGVTHAQREAMQVGSMFGWNVPGVNPAKWERAAPICADVVAVKQEAREIEERAHRRAEG
jgi:hypothetical protein